MERDSIDLGTHKVSVLFRKYFLPTLLGMISMSLVATIDGIFIGQCVGSDGIAAINICVPLILIFSGLGLMSGLGCSVVASIHLSHGKEKAARLNVTQAMLFVTIATIIPTIIILPFSRETGFLLGSSEHLIPQVTDYIIWIMASMIFQIWISVGLFVIRLDGAPKTAMWCSVISALANMLLDGLFVYVLEMGVKGAGIASAISVFIGGTIAIFYMIFKAKRLKLLMPKFSKKSLRLSLRNIGYHCSIGSSSLLGECTMAMLMFMGNQIFMRYMGDNGVGAFGVACYYAPFIFMIGNAIAQSAQPIISYNFGKGNTARVVETRKIVLATAVAFGILVTLMFITCPKYLVGLFLPTNSTVAQIAINGFPYFSTGFIFFISNLAIIGYFQSVKRVVPATVFALLRGCLLLIPCFILLPMLIGNVGIWLAMPLSEVLTFVVICIYYVFKR